MYLNSVNNSSKMPAFKAKWAGVHDSSNSNSRNHAVNLQEMKRFASLDDADLHYIASFEPNEKLKKTKRGVFNTLFLALPAADVLMTSAAKNANLSGKISAGARQAGRWAALFAVGGAVLFGLKNFVNEKVPALADADKKIPVLGFAVDFGAMTAGILGLKKLNQFAAGVINKKFPKQLAYLHKNIKSPLKNALNNSTFNKKLVEPLNSRAFSSVNGWGRSLKIAEALLSPVILSAAFFKGLTSIKEAQKETFENYAFLKTTQNMAKMALSAKVQE